MSAITAVILAAATSNASVVGPLDGKTLVLPGAHYVTEVGTPSERPTTSGGGFEVSVVHHLVGAPEWVFGGLAQAEKLNRWRVAVGGEIGYEYFGLELAGVRELAREGVTSSQWSMQIAPYASVGILWVSARWVIALSNRSAPDAPGDAGMLVVGFKLPIGM